MIIDENQLSPACNILNITIFEITNKDPSHNNIPLIIDENQLSPARNILNITIFEITNKDPPHNNLPKWVL